MIETSKSSRAALLQRIASASSILLGLSVAYAAYVLFLQTPAISLGKLALALVLFVAVAIANYLFTVHYLKERLTSVLEGRIYAVCLCLLLPLLFLPLYYVTPNYPINPLLRTWTDIRLQYDVSANSRPLKFSSKDVALQLDSDTLNASAFSIVGDWNSADRTFALSPGATAALHWFGAASANMRLTVQAPPAGGTLTVYWDQSRTDLELTRASAKQFILVRKFSTPWAVGALLYSAAYVVIAWLLLLFVVLLEGKSTSSSSEWLQRAGKSRVLLLLLVIVLAAVTVKLQLDSLDGGAKTFMTGTQLARHDAVLSGQAPDPWQYRVLAEYVAEGFIRLFQLLKIPEAIGFGFVSLRLLQNVAIFLLAFALYRKVSSSNVIALAGLLLLASGMKNAFYDNDLSFNTYFDLLFYLLAVILILDRKYWWILPVTALAALNRETSALIPFLALAALVDEKLPTPKNLMLFVLPAAAFAAIFIGLHLLYPNRPLYIPYGQQPGMPMLIYNVARAFTWDQLYHTLGLIPVVGLVFIFVWPRLWQRLFLVVCPAWFAIHFVLSVADETRLFLVPLAIIFIPGALFGLKYLQTRHRIRPAAVPASPMRA